jgi:hypothetical protein
VRANLLGLLNLSAGALAGEVRAALNKKDGNGNLQRCICTQRGMDWAGELPIHYALRDAATGPELVCAMLDAGGEAMLGVPDRHKQLPLHLAAGFSWSPAVVALLLARGPPGAVRAEALGHTPLGHARLGNKGPAAEEIIALLRAAMQ